MKKNIILRFLKDSNYSCIYIIILNIFFCCTSTQTPTNFNSKEVSRITKIRKFTVLIFDRNGNEQIEMETYRAGLFFTKNSPKAGGIQKLNFIYGKAFESVLQNKLKSSGSTEIVQYVPPEKLYLIKQEPSMEDMNEEWLQTMQIDAVFTVKQGTLVLDYPSRLPNLGLINLFYTFLVLDLWYVDFFGPWYLKNEFTVSIFFPKIRKEYTERAISGWRYLQKLDYSKITVFDLEDAISNISREGFLKTFEN